MNQIRNCAYCAKTYVMQATKQIWCCELCYFMYKCQPKPINEQECWLWTGSVNRDGYGLSCYKNVSLLAHIRSHILFVNQVPFNKLVLHSCHNPPCVNPLHLRIGTPAENSRDMVIAGRSTKGISFVGGRGVNARSAKLTEEQVREIRQSSDSLSALGRKYNLSATSVSRIKERITWRHLI